MVLGGWAFGTVFMATDPVSAAHSNTGKYIYGLSDRHALPCLIRLASTRRFPEGIMLAILLINLFAPH